MANSADPDQLASLKQADLDLHCLQRQGISGFSRTRVKAGLEFIIPPGWVKVSQIWRQCHIMTEILLTGIFNLNKKIQIITNSALESQTRVRSL